MENLTYTEIIDVLQKMTSDEIIDALSLRDSEELVRALEDYIEDNQETVTENLFLLGVV